MTYTRWIAAAFFLTVLGLAAAEAAAAPAVAPPPRLIGDLRGYRTAAEAAAADPKLFKSAVPTSQGGAGYLGILIEDRNGRPVIEAVEPESPAEAAGLTAGDVLLKLDAAGHATAASVRDALRSRLAGDQLSVTVERQGKPVAVTATLRPTSKPMSATAGRAVLGITLGTKPAAGSGVKVDAVAPGGPADQAKVKAGDVLLKVDGKDADGADGFRAAVAEKRPGDRLELLLERDGKRVEASAVLAAEEAPKGGRSGGWDDRIPNAWRKPTYRLAIIGVEYPDAKHNPKIKDADWEESMFSLGRYQGKSATGEPVHGSMNDYYRELSNGAFKIEGAFVGWVEVSKKRMDYTTGSGTDTREKTALLTEALTKLTEKNKDALKDMDGVFFIYAGGRVQTTRGGLYWPHRASVSFGGKRWPYFIVQEGGTRMNDISVFCHEFGHMLGLPDLYARPELPGSEGAGVWCAMSNQNGGGKPQHFCAWSKEQLGWVKPTVLDPRVKQMLILAPIEDDPTQCYKVMVRADGSEYFLLENRRKRGFDEALPAEGLLIWRVVNNRPILEESHGVDGATGPRVFLGSVPYPSAANTSFTPYTVPSSKSQLGGGLPVHLTNIRRLPNGWITFHIGYEYQ
jgi:immune inhibitor A